MRQLVVWGELGVLSGVGEIDGREEFGEFSEPQQKWEVEPR